MPFLQGWDHYRRETTEDTGKAMAFFERQSSLIPGTAGPMRGLRRRTGDLSPCTGKWLLELNGCAHTKG
jgi:hypothetical protein